MFCSIAGQQLVGKNMKKFLLLASLALSAIIPGAAALAADLDPPPPPVEHLRPATYDWSGFYAGGWVGTACINGTVTDNGTLGTPTYLNAGCGYKGGVLAGYNHQIDDIVFGIEADWGMSNDIVHNIDPTADFRFKLDSIATIRGRLGYAFDDTLLYLTAGGAYARGEFNGIISGTPNNLQQDQFGWVAGLGAEHAFTDSIRFRLESVYTKLGDADYTSLCCNITNHWGDEWETKAALIWAF
jgi:outer membrane immunogenic protein